MPIVLDGDVAAALASYGQPEEATVRLQALDGTWETCGADRARGVWPENLVASANDWGPDKASFDLRRDPRLPWPDIGAASPVEIEVDGTLVWKGRVSETPTRESERTLNVQCEGLQYHLDDDAYERVYVHTKLADYQDMRSKPTAVLGAGQAIAAGQVSNEDGVLTLMFPDGTAVVNGSHVGAVLDLGLYSTAKRIVVEWESSNDAATTFFARASDFADKNGWTAALSDDAFSVVSGGASGTNSGTFATAHRYVHLFYIRTGGAGTFAGDSWFKVKAARVFADTAYESAGQSVLTLDTILKDARNRATITTIIGRDDTQIQTESFGIPDFRIADEPKTPREVLTAANAYEDNQLAVDVNGRMISRTRPTYPLYEIGGWTGADFEDASANSLEEIYNRVIVTGQTPAGDPVRVDRTRDPAIYAAVAASPSPPNPSFDTNTTGWSVFAAALTRDTVVFDSTPASGKFITSAVGASDAQTDFTGTFLAGHTYVAEIRLRPNTTLLNWQLYFGDFATGDYIAYILPAGTAGAFATYRAVWTPRRNSSASSLQLLPVAPLTGATITIWLDTLNLRHMAGSLVDRRGFRRTKILPVKSDLPSDGAAAAKIGDTYLDGHRVTPFKGKLAVTGQAGVRRVLGGQNVHPARMLLGYGEMVRFSDRIDPDTGGVGRDGRIVAVEYRQTENAVSLDLDSTRSNFEALLERLAVVNGAA